MSNQNFPNSIVWQSTGVGAFGGFCIGFVAGRFTGLDAIATGVAGMGIGSMFAHAYTLTVIAKPTQPRQFVESYASETDVINVMTHNDDVTHGSFGKIPTDRRRAVILARGLVQGYPFTESQWTGARQPFTTREFSQIRTAFIVAKWAAWRNENTPQRGAVITSAGMAVMRYYASHPRERRAARNAAAAHARV